MATAPQEMEDLGKIPGALLINFGTIAGQWSIQIMPSDEAHMQRMMIRQVRNVGSR
jgi:hydroxyethylthiazole kinase-like sugar kinase family protein